MTETAIVPNGKTQMNQFTRKVCLALKTRLVPFADYEGAVVFIASQKYAKGWTVEKTVQYLKSLHYSA